MCWDPADSPDDFRILQDGFLLVFFILLILRFQDMIRSVVFWISADFDISGFGRLDFGWF